MQLVTEAGCSLAISGYPRFRYDASGGGGRAAITPPSEPREPWPVRFDPSALHIPELSWRTTTVLGLPLPPGVRISIEPLELAGRIDATQGAVDLRFRALFHCSFGGLYHPPALEVNTLLSSGKAWSRRHQSQGTPLRSDGQVTLAGVAEVPPSGDRWLDAFLGLPDEALAVLRCRLIMHGIGSPS